MKINIELNLVTYDKLDNEDLIPGNGVKLVNFEKKGSIGNSGRFKGIPIDYSAATFRTNGNYNEYESIEMLCQYKIDLEKYLKNIEIAWRLDIAVYTEDMYSMDIDNETIELIHRANTGLAISFYHDSELA